METRRDAEGWRSHEREQRQRWARLTYRQRLEWLEQAKAFAAKAKQAAARRREVG